MNIELTEKEIKQVLNTIVFNKQEDIDLYNKIHDQLYEQSGAEQSGEPSSKEVTENLQELIELAMQRDLAVQIKAKDGDKMPPFVQRKAKRMHKKIALGCIEIKVGLVGSINGLISDTKCVFTNNFASHPRECMNISLKAAVEKLRENN